MTYGQFSVGIGWVIIFFLVIISFFVLLIKSVKKQNKLNKSKLNTLSADEIERYHSLKEKGIISEDEFKAKISFNNNN